MTAAEIGGPALDTAYFPSISAGALQSPSQLSPSSDNQRFYQQPLLAPRIKSFFFFFRHLRSTGRAAERAANADAGIMKDFHALTGQSLDRNPSNNHIQNSGR